MFTIKHEEQIMKKVAVIIISISMSACGMSSLRNVTKPLLVRSFMRSSTLHHKDTAFSPYYQWKPHNDRALQSGVVVYENPSYVDPENQTEILKQQEFYNKIGKALHHYYTPHDALVYLMNTDIKAAQGFIAFFRDINEPDSCGYTILYKVIAANNVEGLELLMSRKELNVNITNDFKHAHGVHHHGTALHLALKKCNPKIIKLLLDAGARL